MMNTSIARLERFIEVPLHGRTDSFLMGHDPIYGCGKWSKRKIEPISVQAAPVTVSAFSMYLEKHRNRTERYGRFIYGPRGSVRTINWGLTPESVEKLRPTNKVLLLDSIFGGPSFLFASPVRKLIPTVDEFVKRHARLEGGFAAFLAPQNPVTMVTWYEAMTFAVLHGGSLPTQKVWEFAARAGRDGNVYGTDTGELTPTNARWNPNYDTTSPEPVKSYAPNPWGFYDMCGNVAEWTADITLVERYAPMFRVSGWVVRGDHFGYDVIEEGRRWLRGGSWRDCSPNELIAGWAVYTDPQNYNQTTGFRIIRQDVSVLPPEYALNMRRL